jgi:hypothetical protein
MPMEPLCSGRPTLAHTTSFRASPRARSRHPLGVTHVCSCIAHEPLQHPLACAPPLRAPALPTVPPTSLRHTRTSPACWARVRLFRCRAVSTSCAPVRLHSPARTRSLPSRAPTPSLPSLRPAHCGCRSPLFGAQPLPPAAPTWCCSLARHPSQRRPPLGSSRPPAPALSLTWSRRSLRLHAAERRPTCSCRAPAHPVPRTAPARTPGRRPASPAPPLPHALARTAWCLGPSPAQHLLGLLLPLRLPLLLHAPAPALTPSCRPTCASSRRRAEPLRSPPQRPARAPPAARLRALAWASPASPRAKLPRRFAWLEERGRKEKNKGRGIGGRIKRNRRGASG